MGLMNFPGNRPYIKDVVVVKNYLDEKELRSLGQIVSGYLDFAERKAEREQTMTMYIFRSIPTHFRIENFQFQTES